MRRILGAVMLLFTLTWQNPVLAEPRAIQIYVNGKALVLPSGQEPFIEEGVTLVPLRAISEALGMEPAWDPVSQTVRLIRSASAIALVIGSPMAQVDGRTLPLRKPARIHRDRTYVPLRFVSEALQAFVAWDGESRSIRVVTQQVPALLPGFDSPELDQAVREKLGRPAGPLPPAELAAIRELTVPNAGITSLQGIEQLTGLERLDLSGNQVADLAPLRSLPRLTSLRLTRLDSYALEAIGNEQGTTLVLELEGPGRSEGEIQAAWEKYRPSFQGDPMLEPVSVSPPYRAGRPAPGFIADGVKVANFARYLAGLPDDLVADEGLNQTSQQTAVLLSRLGFVTHSPERPAEMDEAFYEAGRAGAANSNLGMGFRSLSDLIWVGFMRDGDPGNVGQLGHRRWLLSPTMKRVGFGFSPTGYFSVMYVLDQSREPAAPFDVIAWPAAGRFPVEFFSANDPWSISLNTRLFTPTDSLQVSLRRLSDGREWSLGPDPVDQPDRSFFGVNRESIGQNGPAVIFRPAPGEVQQIRPGDRFAVSLTGLRARATGLPVGISYQVEFMGLGKE